MRQWLGVSLIVLASIAASKAFGQTLPVSTSAGQAEAWYIADELNLAHVIVVPQSITAVVAPRTEPAPAAVTPPVEVAAPAPAPLEPPIMVAAAQTSHHGGSQTASLSTEGVTASPPVAPAMKLPDDAPPAIVTRPQPPRVKPAAVPPPAPVALANSREDICNTLAASANKHGLPIAFFGNLIYQESGLKPRVVSHVGARGIAQFMPGTARMVGLRNPFNPREALPASAKFLRSLLHQFGNNYGLAAAAYNAGPGKVSRWLKHRTVLPKETRDYVMTITGQHADKWRGIRGNRFGHRLTQRIPCTGMPSFARINDPMFQEKDMVRRALNMLPRQPSQTAALIPVSLTTSAAAMPKQDDRIATSPSSATVVASAIDDMTLPRSSASEPSVTASTTSVTKADIAPAPAQRSAALASTAEKHADKADAKKAEAKKAEAKKAEARKTEAKTEAKAEAKKAAAKKLASKAEPKPHAEVRRVAANAAGKEKDAWTEYYASQKKR